MSNLLETQSLFLPHFIVNTTFVFKTMLGWEIEVQAAERVDAFQIGHDVAGVIGCI